MDALEELVEWATSNGVKLNGVTPTRIPGRGTGMVATRDIEVDEIILDVPTRCLRSLSTIPKSRLKRMSDEISVQGLLAADLTLDTSKKYESWKAVCPKPEDFSGMPLLWPPELQALLPPGSRKIFEKQQKKFSRDWDQFFAAFERPGDFESFRHAWLMVNSRTFYWLDAALKNRRGTTKDDHLALQPVADMFNHADEETCRAAYGSDGFSFRATVPHKKGDEVKICYGSHSNDFLLVEYGFIMEDNCWDETLLDDVILPKFDKEQKETLDDYLGNYALDKETICHRTEAALRLFCCTGTHWRHFIDGFSEIGGCQQGADGLFNAPCEPVVNKLLLEVLKECTRDANAAIEKIKDLRVGEQNQIDLLLERWKQILGLYVSRISSLEAS